MVGVFAPMVAPYDPARGDLAARLSPPMSPGYVFGTDHVGRDILSRIMFGGRISLMVAAVSLVSGFIVGTGIGVISGYYGGLVDELITRIVDIWYSLPFLMVAMVCVC